jgi:hypothetical protein
MERPTREPDFTVYLSTDEIEHFWVDKDSPNKGISSTNEIEKPENYYLYEWKLDFEGDILYRRWNEWNSYRYCIDDETADAVRDAYNGFIAEKLILGD